MPPATSSSTTSSSIPPQRTIHALAAKKKGLSVEPFDYVSRPLGVSDVEISITHCGICGSDTHWLNDLWGMAEYPIVPGHEIVGHITATGPGVKDLAVGDRVGVGGMIDACLQRSKPCKPCASGNDSYCPDMVLTYNGKYPDGETTRGGYADYVRVPSNYAFKIPDELPSEMAAPLMCAGLTVYAPLSRHIKSGDRVGVVGIGGLGHIALQFIRAMGAIPVAFSRSRAKEEEARALGAQDFVSMSDPEDVARAARSVDSLLVTVDVDDQPYNAYADLISSNGKLLMVGAPNEMRISVLKLLFAGISVHGSLMGSQQEAKEMLALAAKENVRPVIQKLPMKEANKGLEMVHNGSVRYRVVLEN